MLIQQVKSCTFIVKLVLVFKNLFSFCIMRLLIFEQILTDSDVDEINR